MKVEGSERMGSATATSRSILSISATALLCLTSGVRPTACPDGTALGVQDQTKKQEVHTQTLKRGADTQTVRPSDNQTLKDIQTLGVFLFYRAAGTYAHES